MEIKLIILLVSGPMFLLSIGAHIFVKIKLNPGADTDLDEYHFEFEDHHPGYQRYSKWSRITFTAAAISALGLFVGIVL
jgi:hypothetical protein